MSTEAIRATNQRTAAPRVAAVDRALSLLEVFTTAEPMLSLSELADRSGQYKSTVLRLLASLEHAGLVRRRDDGRFTLGSAVPRLHAVYGASFSLREAVRPTLEALGARPRESAAVHVEHGGRDLCLERVDSPQAVRDHARAGDLESLDDSIGGCVLRAFAGARGARAARIRRDRLLVADGDIVPEVAGIAAPVFGADGRIAGAILLTMPSTRLRMDHAAAVKRAAADLTMELGGPPDGLNAAPGSSGIRGNPR
jgi:DNA-binding IclR family transcriptional regulator